MEILWAVALLPIFGIGYWVGFLNQRRKAHDEQMALAVEHVREKSDLSAQVQAVQVKYATLQENFEATKAQGEELSSTMKNEFKLMAQALLEEKSTRFLDLNQKNMFGILEPLKERLKDFEKKVDEVYATEGRERGMLRGELNKLLELNVAMSQEARNLTQALKGENKTQGNWGELVLESILEKSGLRSGQEFITQGEDMGLKGEEGNRLQPDVIVNVPGNRHIVVDAKMTLKAYEAYASAEDGVARDTFARQHVKSLEDHINNLSAKKYHAADKLISPDFVLLFMPLEPAFALAFKLKPEIFQQAWDKNIAIVSPTTLLTTLRTVASLWKQERQQRNAQDIAKRGGLLYDKFVGLVSDLKNLGEKLEGAQKAHSDVFKKLSEGKGNLIGQVEELKDLGVKTEKSLPQIEG